jgi:hypothetical protein
VTRSSHKFDCEAYGPEGAAFGAVCFVSGQPGQRVCASADECARTMAAARKWLFRRISERAAQGDDVAAYLATEFVSPDQLLGGSEQT